MQFFPPQTNELGGHDRSNFRARQFSCQSYSSSGSNFGAIVYLENDALRSDRHLTCFME